MIRLDEISQHALERELERARLCPPCAKGNHKRHNSEYMDKRGKVRVCLCSICKKGNRK